MTSLFDIASGIAALIVPNKGGRSAITEPSALLTSVLSGQFNIASLPESGKRFGYDIMASVLALDPNGALDINGNGSMSKVIIGAAIAKKVINTIHKTDYSVNIPLINKKVDLL